MRTTGCTRIALAAAIALLGGCRPQPKAEHQSETRPALAGWRRVGSWSGRGNTQTDSFEIGFEQCRIRWEAKNESSPGAGRLRVTVNSAVSGRELAPAVDHRGAGKDLVYVSVEPHFSYLVIESSNVDWSVTVEEPELRVGLGSR